MRDIQSEPQLLIERLVMRCPRCKVDLVLDEEKRYRTLAEHASDSNMECPSKPTYICPNKCYPEGDFFGIDGDLYTKGSYKDWLEMPEKDKYALDGIDRQVRIDLIILDLYQGRIDKGECLNKLSELKIEGEDDILPIPSKLQIIMFRLKNKVIWHIKQKRQFRKRFQVRKA